MKRNEFINVSLHLRQIDTMVVFNHIYKRGNFYDLLGPVVQN